MVFPFSFSPILPFLCLFRGDISTDICRLEKRNCCVTFLPSHRPPFFIKREKPSFHFELSLKTSPLSRRQNQEFELSLKTFLEQKKKKQKIQKIELISNGSNGKKLALGMFLELYLFQYYFGSNFSFFLFISNKFLFFGSRKFPS